MTTYYCSDPHAFHRKAMRIGRRLAFMTEPDRQGFLAIEAGGGDLRSFRACDESVDRMNRGLAANINARVGPGDVLWCLGDWAFGRGGDARRNARWFRDRIRCRTVNLIWGNHDDRKKIRDLFHHARDQAEVRDGAARITLNHYPLLTWRGQRHAGPDRPSIHLYGHLHGLYQAEPGANPLRDAAAWPALDVGFDAHEYQVWSLEEIMERLRPRLVALRAATRNNGPEAC